MIYGYNNPNAQEDTLNISFKSAKVNIGVTNSGPALNIVESGYHHQSPPQARGEKLQLSRQPTINQGGFSDKANGVQQILSRNNGLNENTYKSH